MIQDWSQHQQIAGSLADDLVGDIHSNGPSLTRGRLLSAAIEAVKRYRKASKMFDRCSLKLTDAIEAAEQKHGHQPLPAIRWRNYYIGGGEIDRTRGFFLAAGEDRATIEGEYRDAKKRYRAAVKAAKDWEKRVGVEGLSELLERARTELHDAQKALGAVQPEFVTDAAAILDVVRANAEEFGETAEWEIAVMTKASTFLSRVTAIA